MSSEFDADVERVTSGTHAIINLDAYISNIATLRSMVPTGTAFMAVVKADGYGHGASECARAASDAGAEMLGVARISEALYVRDSGVVTPIVVIGPPSVGELERAIRRDVSLAVGSRSSADAVLAAAESARVPARIHVKIDTGMRRFGFRPEVAEDEVVALARSEQVVVEGIFTHYTSADESVRDPTGKQLDAFLKVVDRLAGCGVRPRFVHAANSAGIMTGMTHGTNLVRAGIATYGLSPSAEVPVDERFAPVLAIRSTLARRDRLAAGDGVSYGLGYRSPEGEPIGTIPIGYADGLPRQLANQGWFVVAGERAPIRGRVCMDQTIVGVPVDANESDPVTIVGTAADGAMTLDDVARLAGTNNYEVATRVLARVPRIFVKGGVPVAWECVLTGERARRP